MRRLNDFCRTSGAFRCEVGVSPIFGIFGIARLGGGGGGGGGGSRFGSGAVGSCANAGTTLSDRMNAATANFERLCIANLPTYLLTLRRPAGPSRRARPWHLVLR